MEDCEAVSTALVHWNRGVAFDVTRLLMEHLEAASTALALRNNRGSDL